MGKQKFLFLFIILLHCSVFSQIKIKELPPYNLEDIDSSFFEISHSRKVKHLQSGWEVFTQDNIETKVKISVPSTFEGESTLIYQKSINISQQEIEDNDITLNFLGLNYSAEILFNEQLIYKHTGGEFPFHVLLDPKDLLIGENKLIVKVFYELDSEYTIPLKHSFMFPESKGGITRDVFLRFTPKAHMFISEFNYEFNSRYTYLEVSSIVKTTFTDTLKRMRDVEDDPLETNILFEFWHEQDTSAIYSRERKLNFGGSNTDESSFKFRIYAPKLWQLKSPEKYSLNIYLTHGDKLIDHVKKEITFSRFEERHEGIFLNDEQVKFEGTTYIYSGDEYGPLVTYDQLKKDLNLIKQVGFNTVRFSKHLPHPYALRLCEQLGMYAFIELPLNSMPESFADDPSSIQRAKVYLNHIVEEYSNFNALFAIGVGTSFLGNSQLHRDFISELAEIIKTKSTKFSYASFIGFPTSSIDSLDFYGAEIYLTPQSDIQNYFTDTLSLNKNQIFISEVTYPVFKGESNGYLNNNTFEAQAKQYEKLLNHFSQENSAGFFLNTFADYNGEYPSFYSGFSEDGEYVVGITGKDRGSNRLAYKVVASKFNNSEKVTVPIGTKTDDSPLLFILTGLVLSLLTGILVNSKKKFRQDATRALLRPYNFFADIRDHRILSGVHAVILMFILAATHSLLLTNLLHYLRTNILLEKILLSLGKESLIIVIGHLAWHPTDALIELFIFSLIFFLMITLAIKIFSMFLRTRVYYSNIFFVVIWSLLPLALLIPLELVLYKILEANVVNYYIYAILAVYAFWLLLRLLKGVYVIFDINPGKVYLNCFLLILVLTAGTLFYFQITETSLYYIINSFKQYYLM